MSEQPKLEILWMGEHHGQIRVVRYADVEPLLEELIALRRQLAHLEAEEADSATLRTELTGLLNGVADALKGPPAPGYGHCWADLPTIAAEKMARLKGADAALLACQQERDYSVNRYNAAMKHYETVVRELTDHQDELQQQLGQAEADRSTLQAQLAECQRGRVGDAEIIGRWQCQTEALQAQIGPLREALGHVALVSALITEWQNNSEGLTIEEVCHWNDELRAALQTAPPPQREQA